jgi:hypothetical protein
MTQTSTPKFVEEVVAEVTKADKAIELFHTMAIMSLNMGNLILKVNTLKNNWLWGEGKGSVIRGIRLKKIFLEGV